MVFYVRILYWYVIITPNVQTLHRMYIVNAGPGFKKMLWPAAQKFLDAKTITKIQVMGYSQAYLIVFLMQPQLTLYLSS